MAGLSTINWRHLYCKAFHRKQIKAEDLRESPPSSPRFGTSTYGPSSPSSSSSQHQFHHLKRQLNLFQLTLLGVGGSIGVGIFTLTGIAASLAGPGVIFSYLFAGLIAVLDALCYAEMASRYPLAGSVFLYCHLAFALLIGFNLLVDYHIAASLIARSFAIYLVELFRSFGLSVPSWVSSIAINKVISISFIAPLLLLLLTVVLCRGASHGAWLNLVLTSIKVFVILLVCVVGLTRLNSTNWTPFFPFGIESVFSTSATVFFSYVGFDTIAASSEECKNPLRDLPLAILVSLGICCSLYVAVCLVITGIVSYKDIDVAAPLASAFEGLGLGWVQTVIALGGVVGLATTLLIGLFAQSRVYLSVARDGLIPAALAEIHPIYKTPLMAQALCGGLAMTLATFFNVKLLSEILDIGVIIGYGTVCATVLVQRSENRVHTVHWLVILVLGSSIPFVCHKYKMSPIISGVTLLLPAGAVIALIYRQSYPSPSGAFCCPWVPIVPLAGVLLNVYLAVNLTFWAWLRLAVLWILLIAYYVWQEVKRQKGGLIGFRECLLSPPTQGVVSCSMGNEALRRRRGGGGGGIPPGSASSSSTTKLENPLLINDRV